MRINVNDLREEPLELDIDVPPESLLLAVEGFSFPRPVTGHVRFQMVGQRILAMGGLQTRVGTACIRCLAPIEVAIAAEVGLVFEKRPAAVEGNEDAQVATEWDAESQGTECYQEDELDPTEPFRQLLTLELPNYPLCRSDCRGLCPTCSADLNRGHCQCKTAAGVTVGESDWKDCLKGIHLDQEERR